MTGYENRRLFLLRLGDLSPQTFRPAGLQALAEEGPTPVPPSGRFRWVFVHLCWGNVL